MIAVGISFATSLLTAIRFYKNLFSDEGYLTLTLPVTRGQHLFSKTIVGTAWCLLDQLLLLGSIFLIFHAEPLRDLFNANKAELLEAFGFTGAYADLTLLKIALYVLLFLSLIHILPAYTRRSQFSQKTENKAPQWLHNLLPNSPA